MFVLFRRTLMTLLLMGLLCPWASAEPVPEPMPEWARDAVRKLYEQGLLRGYPPGQASPAETTTRNETAELLERLDQQRLTEQAQFSDRSEVEATSTEANELRQQLEELEQRVDSLEQGTDNLELRQEETARPGF
jgi:hypothetical protein